MILLKQIAQGGILVLPVQPQEVAVQGVLALLPAGGHHVGHDREEDPALGEADEEPERVGLAAKARPPGVVVDALEGPLVPPQELLDRLGRHHRARH